MPAASDLKEQAAPVLVQLKPLSEMAVACAEQECKVTVREDHRWGLPILNHPADQFLLTVRHLGVIVLRFSALSMQGPWRWEPEFTTAKGLALVSHLLKEAD